MAELKIRCVDERIVHMLDEIAEKENYHSRNDLLLEILRLYVTSHHEFFAKSIPPTVLFLCREAIGEQQQSLDAALNLTYQVNAQVLKKLSELHALFFAELPPEEKSS